MNIIGICPYETPCGWCSKWDKKCDKKMPERGLRAKTKPVDDAMKPCYNCQKQDWLVPECGECGVSNGFKYFEPKGITNA